MKTTKKIGQVERTKTSADPNPFKCQKLSEERGPQHEGKNIGQETAAGAEVMKLTAREKAVIYTGKLLRGGDGFSPEEYRDPIAIRCAIELLGCRNGSKVHSAAAFLRDAAKKGTDVSAAVPALIKVIEEFEEHEDHAIRRVCDALQVLAERNYDISEGIDAMIKLQLHGAEGERCYCPGLIRAALLFCPNDDKMARAIKTFVSGIISSYSSDKRYDIPNYESRFIEPLTEMASMGCERINKAITAEILWHIRSKWMAKESNGNSAEFEHAITVFAKIMETVQKAEKGTVVVVRPH